MKPVFWVANSHYSRASAPITLLVFIIVNARISTKCCRFNAVIKILCTLLQKAELIKISKTLHAKNIK